MKTRINALISMTFLMAFLSACESPRRNLSAAHNTNSEAIRNNCCSLLYQLLSQEKDVKMLRLIKRENPVLKAMINRVSSSSRKGAEKLESFAKKDAAFRLDEINLPAGETKTRDDVSAQTEKQLLHASGEHLEVLLLLTQIQALDYAAHLAKVAGQNDLQQERSDYLLDLGGQMGSLHDELVVLLEEDLGRKPGTGK